MSNETNQFAGLEGEALAAALEEQAFTTSNEEVRRDITLNERQDFANRQVEISEEEMTIDEDIALYCAPKRAQLKEIKAERKNIAKTTKQGFIKQETKIFWIQDFDNRQMIGYDATGTELIRRRMTGAERQGMTLHMNREASNAS